VTRSNLPIFIDRNDPFLCPQTPGDHIEIRDKVKALAIKHGCMIIVSSQRPTGFDYRLLSEVEP